MHFHRAYGALEAHRKVVWEAGRSPVPSYDALESPHALPGGLGLCAADHVLVDARDGVAEAVARA